ncbi:hypothetical protein F6V30_13990 [Oryzomonas sagensis]|uniref:KfrB domain-containing protein n=1 Tax=Oryzomonas sagensis TaxID=2603857 RepID=A0ABQ6TL05_9BACT|nr:hypothetical protein [Oryzomonas sagensis]KAB0668944.1 hypothetical protein F6V30_13990 [Oryzomonas sagensis]
MTTQEEILSRFVVKVVKPEPDTRITIAGQSFIHPSDNHHDGTAVLTESFISDGKQHKSTAILMPADKRYRDAEPAPYAIVPSHTADHLKATNKTYLYSDPFLPDEVKKK